MERQAGIKPGLVWALAEAADQRIKKGFMLEGTLKTL